MQERKNRRPVEAKASECETFPRGIIERYESAQNVFGYDEDGERQSNLSRRVQVTGEFGPVINDLPGDPRITSLVDLYHAS